MDIKKRAFGLSLALAVGVGLGLNAEAIAAPDAAQTPASQPIVRTLNEEFKLTTTDNGIYCQDAQGKAVLGWQEVDGSVYYFQKGSGYAKCGWAFIDGNWYNFDNDGKLKLGWSTWSGNKYYATGEGELGKKGSLVSGWQEIDGKTYYFDAADMSRAVRAWTKISGKWYKFKDNSQLMVGPISYSPSFCYANPEGGFGERGSMVNGWKEIDGNTYYFNPNTGSLAETGWAKISGKWYIFDNDGKLKTGLIPYDGSVCYADPDLGGAIFEGGWKTVEGKRYYFNPNGGVAAKGWFKGDKGEWYKLNSSGDVIEGLIPYDGSVCYADPDLGGAIFEGGWKTIGSDTYFFKSGGGVAINGWAKISGKWYKFARDGKLQTGLISYDGSVCYADPDLGGAIFEGGWKTVEGKRYYFKSNGGVAATGWFKGDKGEWYKLDSSGNVVEGLISYDGSVCYADPDLGGAIFEGGWKTIGKDKYFFKSGGGVAINSWAKISGKWYKFARDGKLQTGWIDYGNDRWSYADPDAKDNLYGACVTGAHTINGVKYVFDSDCIVKCGWSKTSRGWAYQDPKSGAAIRGWKYIDGHYYYFIDGVCVRGMVKVDKKIYYLDWNTYQLPINEWIYFKGGSYAGKCAYATKDGSLAVGDAVVNGIKYSFDSQGLIPSNKRADRCPYYISSSTNYCITVDRTNCMVYVYHWEDGNWTRWYTWRSTNGGWRTPLGHHYISYRANPRPYNPFGVDHGYAAFWFVNFSNGCGFHTLLYLPYDWWKLPARQQLGTHESMGCIRLEEENAHWIYSNIPRNTSVYVYE